MNGYSYPAGYPLPPLICQQYQYVCQFCIDTRKLQLRYSNTLQLIDIPVPVPVHVAQVRLSTEKYKSLFSDISVLTGQYFQKSYRPTTNQEADWHHR